MTKVKKVKIKTEPRKGKSATQPGAIVPVPFHSPEIIPAKGVKKPATPFEEAKTPLERLEIAQGGKSMQMRPVHPSSLESIKAEFMETYELNKSDVDFRYDETGMQLFITWK